MDKRPAFHLDHHDFTHMTTSFFWFLWFHLSMTITVYDNGHYLMDKRPAFHLDHHDFTQALVLSTSPV